MRSKGIVLNHHNQEVLNCFLCINNKFLSHKHGNKRKCKTCIDGSNFNHTPKEQANASIGNNKGVRDDRRNKAGR